MGNAGLTDATLLSGLRIRTFLNGVPQETNSDASLLQLNVLPGGQTRVSFPTTMPFDAVSIERTSVASVLDNMQLYYGFGLEPRAFGQVKQVISDFSNTTNHASSSAASQVCATVGVGALAVTTCVTTASVQNPQNAASVDPNDFAQFSSVLAAAGSQFLKVDLKGTGVAGNRAGMVIGDGLLSGGLLDVSVLKNFTLSTYDAAGNLVESASAGNLLSIGLLPNGRDELSFLTTMPFASVRLDVASGVALLSGMKVFNAFADDPQAVLPVPPSPLPVVLTDFTGRRTATRTELTWATASEHSSSLFIAERRAGSAAEFQAVGQVAAAGSSSEAHRYQYTDAAARHGAVLSPAAGRRRRHHRVLARGGPGRWGPGRWPASVPQPRAGVGRPPALRRHRGCQRLCLLGDGPACAASAPGRRSRRRGGAARYHVVVRDGAGNRMAAQRLVVAGQ